MSSSVQPEAAEWSGGATTRTANQTVRVYLNEAKYEFLMRLRLPVYVVPTIIFPVMFYVLFGLSHSRAQLGSTTVGAYLLATFGTFGVIAISLFGFGVGVAIERGQGWLQVKRASPMPASAYFAAKIVMCLLFSIIMIAVLFTIGVVFGHVRMPVTSWLALIGTLLLGVLPFAAMGLAVGCFAGPNSAPGVSNLIYLPMSFASGLWTPLEFLPKFVQHAAPFLPPYHLAQLALSQIGTGHGNVWAHVIALIGFALLFLALAAWGFRRNEDKMYG